MCLYLHLNTGAIYGQKRVWNYLELQALVTTRNKCKETNVGPLHEKYVDLKVRNIPPVPNISHLIVIQKKELIFYLSKHFPDNLHFILL